MTGSLYVIVRTIHVLAESRTRSIAIVVSRMYKVWIDQDLCTGDGLCAEIEPAIFEMHDDGLAYVKEVGWPNILNGGTEPALQMAEGMAAIPEDLLSNVIDAAEECPGECIYIDA